MFSIKLFIYTSIQQAFIQHQLCANTVLGNRKNKSWSCNWKKTRTHRQISNHIIKHFNKIQSNHLTEENRSFLGVAEERNPIQHGRTTQKLFLWERSPWTGVTPAHYKYDPNVSIFHYNGASQYTTCSFPSDKPFSTCYGWKWLDNIILLKVSLFF